MLSDGRPVVLRDESLSSRIGRWDGSAVGDLRELGVLAQHREIVIVAGELG